MENRTENKTEHETRGEKTNTSLNKKTTTNTQTKTIVYMHESFGYRECIALLSRVYRLVIASASFVFIARQLLLL